MFSFRIFLCISFIVYIFQLKDQFDLICLFVAVNLVAQINNNYLSFDCWIIAFIQQYFIFKNNKVEEYYLISYPYLIIFISIFYINSQENNLFINKNLISKDFRNLIRIQNKMNNNNNNKIRKLKEHRNLFGQKSRL
ncbi:unnamed protein product [Paramecium sonneborni]|uniref:Transmembrane protein n=1 Tax=Paramecium sonneborni TaxID=65129 RepID=A0A8S1NF55_9CILI|nr:unnamed protein product [Paramecium sonneborni]